MRNEVGIEGQIVAANDAAKIWRHARLAKLCACIFFHFYSDEAQGILRLLEEQGRVSSPA
jgi:hypothetical protein